MDPQYQQLLVSLHILMYMEILMPLTLHFNPVKVLEYRRPSQLGHVIIKSFILHAKFEFDVHKICTKMYYEIT